MRTKDFPGHDSGALREMDIGLLKAALESVPHGVSVWDRDFRLIFCNDEYLRLHKLPESLIKPGVPLRQVFEASVAAGNYPGKTAEEAEAELRARLTEKGRTVTLDLTKADGRIIRITSSPLPDGAWLVAHEDVSEINHYIRALREREEELLLQNMRFDHAINNMPQGLCMFGGDRRIVVWNRQYTEMYNIPPGQLRRGDPIEKVLRQRVEAGNRPIGGGDAFVNNRLAVTDDGTAASFIVEMEDGRVISVLHRPLDDGGWVATHHDITEQRRNEERIRYLARHDALTGLPNRILLHEQMQALEARVERGETMAVMCIDVDHFKTVNDTLGHAVGDAVLQEVAARLLTAGRDGEVVARLGGDEFALLHGPLVEGGDAASLAARVVGAMAEPIAVEGNQVLIGASVGIAIAPTDGRSADALLKAADLACYRAKRDGRGTYDFFEKSMDTAARERRQLEMWLRTALVKNQLSLDYQPLYDLATNRISGVEALLRWRHPERGLIPPSEFIPIAEDTGLIVPIGAWVLRQACADAAAWPAHVKVAVNLSPVQFKKNYSLAEVVVSALASGGLRAERLELEITESVMLTQIDGVLRTLHQLRGMGVKICMDDFGTGYSSLSYLRAFPFDKIKIDRSFIQDSSIREDGTEIIEAVVGLGKSMGMSITAEGVETPDQLRLVTEQGCTEAQGYLLGRPLPAAAISGLFAAEQFHGVREPDLPRAPRLVRSA